MRQLNKQYIGFISGLFGPLVGAFIFYLLKFTHLSFIQFLENIIEANIQSEMISLSCIFNLILFFIFIRLNWQKAARGVILATFVYVLIVILLKSF